MALAQRWQKRFALVLDPRSLAERGDWLAQGQAWPPVRKAARPRYPHDAEPTQALGAVVDECLAQVLHNTFGLIEGDPAQRVEHVHQLRVGIRRLRSGLRCFEGWAPMPPDELVAGLRALFTQLGESRDADVLDSGVAQALAHAGAPALSFDTAPGATDPAALLRSEAMQRLLLRWLAWLASLSPPHPNAETEENADADSQTAAPADTLNTPEQLDDLPTAADAHGDGRLPRRAARRLASRRPGSRWVGCPRRSKRYVPPRRRCCDGWPSANHRKQRADWPASCLRCKRLAGTRTSRCSRPRRPWRWSAKR